MASEIWIVESGDYPEDRTIFFVAASAEIAIRELKRTFEVPPYILKWDEPVQETSDLWKLTGHFEEVLHHSTRHDCTYEITRWDVHE